MREVVDGVTGIPHPEEAAERLSRRTHGADPASRQFPDSLFRRDGEGVFADRTQLKWCGLLKKAVLV